ncbi:MAG: tetratricopeptide repeat protein [Exilispira sp.]
MNKIPFILNNLNNKFLILIKYTFIIFVIFFESQICLAYSIDDLIIDILSLYNNNINNNEKEIIITRITLYIELIKNNNEKLIELSQKISSISKKQQLLIYKVLKRYLINTTLKILFSQIKEINEFDINYKIDDKTHSIVVINENFSILNTTFSEQNNEKKKDNNNDENKINSTNQQADKSQNIKISSNSNNSSSNSENNSSNQTNTEIPSNNKNNNKSEKPQFSIEGIKTPSILELQNNYTENELDAIYKNSLKSYYNGEIDNAFNGFWICIVNNFNKDNSIYYLALIYEKNKDYNSAIILYKNAINLFTSRSNIDYKFISYLYKRLGTSYIQIKVYEEAILYLKKAIEYLPSDGEIYYLIGLSYYNLQNYDKAKEYFQKSYQLGYQKALEYLKKL